MSDDQFPYEYGSDLHWLWGWGERLKQRLAGASEPNQHDWMIFRPDRLASDAMTRFGALHPTIIAQVQDYLRFTELRFEEFQTLHPDETASANFADAMEDLQCRIAVAVETIAEAESNKKEAATSDHAADVVDQTPCPRYDADRRVLSYDGEIVKIYGKTKAENQTLVLAAFEESGWPVTIDDPLKPGRLADTIKGLNRARKTERIEFYGDGTGTKVGWRVVS